MSGARVKVPRVYPSINAITADLAVSGIAKAQVNEADGYKFRGIDDVLGCLAPLLARHRLSILPRVLERNSTSRQDESGALLVSVCLKVAFDIVSARDGSMHTIEVFGEALDTGDKATAKAMSAAYKHAMLLAFCIPVDETDDTDASGHQLLSGSDLPDPVQGWEQWSSDIQFMIGSCTSDEAIGRLQKTYHTELRAASKRQPEIYSAIGNAVVQRRKALAGMVPVGPNAKPPKSDSVRKADAHA